jgi:hypothetical protein
MTTEPVELRVYTFGNTPHTDDGDYRPTAQAIRDSKPCTSPKNSASTT